jgi:hypothetical protein
MPVLLAASLIQLLRCCRWALPWVVDGDGRAVCLSVWLQVAHRCRCRNHKDCSKQETAAFYLGRQGKVPPLNATQEADVDHMFVGNWR